MMKSDRFCGMMATALILLLGVSARGQGTTRPTTRPMGRAATQRIFNPTDTDIGDPEALRRAQYKAQMEAMKSQALVEVETLIPEIRKQLASSPRQAVDRLNRGAMQTLLAAEKFDEVEEFAIAGSIAMARDTWPLEQLQRFRVRAFEARGRNKDALATAKALFNLAGTVSAPHDLKMIARCLAAANPGDPAIANRFKLQQLAGAQVDEGSRKKAMEGLGENILAGIEVDAKTFEAAIAARGQAKDFDTMYGLGNLLLLSGRISEARQVFQRVYKAAPPGEIQYASEGLVKVIKAEDCGIGRANAFVAVIAPKE